MYQITCDGYIIYDPRFPDYIITKGVLRLELNKADSLTFTIFPNHPNFAALKKLKSDIVVYDGNNVIFRGRILDETIGWHNEVTCVCEGAFAFLNDTIQRPFAFPIDDQHTTPADYFTFLIGRHNEQEESRRQITLGNCTVTDPNGYIARSDTEYSTTYRLLKEGLLDTLGGYLFMRYSESGATIDYLDDFTIQANQPIRFGLNLLALSTTKKGDSIVTAILPLGAKDETTGERLTIGGLEDSDWSDVHKRGDIVYSETAETIYGARIIKVVVFDDVTIAANLLTKARGELAKAILAPQTISITAADLSRAGYEYNTFRLGTYVLIEDNAHATAHNLALRYLVSKLSIDLLNPASNKLTLGATTASLIDSQKADLSQGMQRVEDLTKEETIRQVRELEERTSTELSRSEEAILSRVAQEYYDKNATDAKVSELSTQLTQTAADWTFAFTNYQQDIDGQFSDIRSYIQFVDGDIILGRNDSEITLKVENDQIGIYQNGVLITYWRYDRQYTPSVLEVPVGGKVIFGDYAFIPRSNGSLDLSWIGE